MTSLKEFFGHRFEELAGLSPEMLINLISRENISLEVEEKTPRCPALHFQESVSDVE